MRQQTTDDSGASVQTPTLSAAVIPNPKAADYLASLSPTTQHHICRYLALVLGMSEVPALTNEETA